MLYHGSDDGKILMLQPMRSEHGKPYIYFSKNIVVAAFYTVHCVERPYNWFPYGFDGQIPCYCEYYPDALRDVYYGHGGYIYCCEDSAAPYNPTEINCACVSEKPVVPTEVIEIDDMFEWFCEKRKNGEMKIVRYDRNRKIAPMICAEIEKYRLKQNPDCSYSAFLKEKLPEAWEDCI